MNDEIKESLIAFEFAFCTIFKRVAIRGKRGWNVTLTRTVEIETAMDLLVNVRDGMGVNKLNPYLSTIPGGSEFFILGPPMLYLKMKSCDMSCPQVITPTNLRKHIATLSQLLNLQESELELLANHLGHDITVDRGFYQLPEDTLNLAKVGKLLLALEKGFSRYSG